VMDKFAYEVGASIGLLKFGSVTKLERRTAKLFKIAKLLQKKGKLTKAAFKWPWDYSGVDHTPAERQKQIREKVTAEGVATKERGGGGSADPLTEAGDDLISRGQGTKGVFGSIRQGAPTSSKGKKGNNGPISLNDSDDWDGKSPLSLYDSDDWDEKSPLSLNDSDDWDEKSPLSLDSGGGRRDRHRRSHRRNMQLYGVDAANRMKAGGGQPGGGPSKEEQGFWGGPKFGDMQRFWLQMLGKTPSQMRGEDLAREAGYGRAVGHKKNLDWIRSMLMGPQTGHYGMG